MLVFRQCVTASHCHTLGKLCSVYSGFCVTFCIVLVFYSDLLKCFGFYMVQLFCCLTVL